MNEIKPEITYEDFTKLDIRAGTVVSAERVEGSEKLIKLQVDFGPEIGQRQILTGLLKWYKPEDFIGFQTTFILNLPPRKMIGLVSEGMILASSSRAQEAPITERISIQWPRSMMSIRVTSSQKKNLPGRPTTTAEL